MGYEPSCRPADDVHGGFRILQELNRFDLTEDAQAMPMDTAGTIFYHNRWVPYSHAIWHLFVIGGSVTHYLAISWYVLLPAA